MDSTSSPSPLSAADDGAFEQYEYDSADDDNDIEIKNATETKAPQKFTNPLSQLHQIVNEYNLM